MKIIALDLGLSRIGVAISDGTIVSSLETIKIYNRQDALQRVSEVCRNEQAEKIVLGMPKSDNHESEDMVRSFAMELTKILSLPIEFVDETLTSKEAERLLAHSGLDPRSERYKKEVDRIAAKLILEQYLNENKLANN